MKLERDSQRKSSGVISWSYRQSEEMNCLFKSAHQTAWLESERKYIHVRAACIPIIFNVERMLNEFQEYKKNRTILLLK